MRQQVVAAVGAIVTLGLFFLTHAKRLADFFAVIRLPTDVGEALTKMATVPALVSWGCLAIGAFCVGYLIFDYFRGSQEPVPVPLVTGKNLPSSGIVAPKGTPRRGDKLITLGQYIVIVSFFGTMTGLALMIIGYRQNTAERNQLVEAVIVAATKVSELFTASTPSVKPEVIAEPERVFVPPELTLERLFSFYEQITEIQAAELTKRYIGQWIKVSGPVGTVLPFNGQFSLVRFERIPIFERKTALDQASIYLRFKEQWVDRLAVLKLGDKITAICQIDSIDSVTLHLQKYELVDNPEPPATAPAQSPNSPVRPRRRRVRRPPQA